MDNEQNFETYLFISPEKFLISVKKKSNFEEVYKNEETFKDNSNLNLIFLDSFLNKNIFKIEKLLSRFVKNIFVILDCKEFFPVQISLKNNNYQKLFLPKNLNYLLNEAKDQCFETLRDKKIIHFLIDQYLIDGEIYDYLPENLNCNFISLDISFICLPLKFIKSLDAITKKYYISTNKIISMEYMRSLFSDEKFDIIKMAKEIIDGYNQSEVVLISKKVKKNGLFERFFHFFN